MTDSGPRLHAALPLDCSVQSPLAYGWLRAPGSALLAAPPPISLPLLPLQYNKATVALQGELPIMVPILFLLAVFVPYTMGWVLGCTHNLPVQPILFLTNMDLVRARAVVFVFERGGWGQGRR